LDPFEGGGLIKLFRKRGEETLPFKGRAWVGMGLLVQPDK